MSSPTCSSSSSSIDDELKETKLAIKELEKEMKECVDAFKLQTLTLIWKENRSI